MSKSWVSVFLLIVIPSSFGIASSSAAEGEPELISLYKYKPMYFIMGNPYTKIQVSFKARLSKNIPIYFAYSQLMFWNLFISSPYFHDINYDPLLFYRFMIDHEKDQWIDVIPWEHESNGKGGELERAWDRFAVMYNVSHRLGEKSRLHWSIKAWIPIRYNPNNKDLADYRGLWELNLTLQDFLGDFFAFDDVIFRLYPGGESQLDPFRGGQELTLRSSFHRTKFLPMIVGQIFHGFGESLLDYTEERWGFRIGAGF